MFKNSFQEREAMSTLTKLIIVVSAMMTLLANTAVAHDDSDRNEIKRAVSTYVKALTASNLEGVVAQYASDGVFMPPNSQPIVGIKAVRAAYTNTFKNIDIDADEFVIDEVVQISPGWAFVRSHAQGSTTSVATRAKISEGGTKELFVLQKQSDGNWKIARYAFSSTNPPRR